MGSSRCRGGEHAPNGLAATASTGYAGHIFEELCGFPLPQLPAIVSADLRSDFLCHTFLGHRLAAQESLLHTPHRRLAPSGVQQIETPQQQLCCMRTAIFGGIQCLQICICIRAVRLSRFVELSQLSGGFLTESSTSAPPSGTEAQEQRRPFCPTRPQRQRRCSACCATPRRPARKTNGRAGTAPVRRCSLACRRCCQPETGAVPQLAVRELAA